MTKIKELSQNLANQIAAGEVVERPSSVVKELLENAIDSGSTKIDVFVEEAGLKSIQVIDNGEGIAPDDVLNAFKRHATSKIKRQEDLFRIRSLGFRGEALPSIASVSEVKLETSTGEEGSYLVLSGGKVIEHRPHSLRKGTSISVSNLFFNTPARLKYMKSLQTELSHVVDVVNRLAMSHPEIAFQLVHDGNQMLRTLGKGDLKQAIAGVYGVPVAKKMMLITGEDLDFTLTGYLSLPEVTRSNRYYLSVIINGRYVKNWAISKSIVEGYGSKLMVGRFPVGVLSITMDPSLLDVNVHPTKQEVQLSKEKELCDLIKKSIMQSLANEVLIPGVSEAASFKKKIQQEDKVSQISLSLPNKPAKDTRPISKTGLSYDAVTGQFSAKNNESNIEQVKLYEAQNIVEDESVVSEILKTPEFVDNNDTLVEDLEKEVPVKIKPDFPELEYVGQMHGTYLFAQNKDGLFIVDQHAAQERIKYEFFREKIADVGEDRQELLVPMVIDCSIDDSLAIREGKEILEKCGIELEEFGSRSFLVRSHPTWFPKDREQATIEEMIDIFLENGKISIKEFREDTAIMMSCKQSIKANHYLNDLQARALLEELNHCENPYNCPHGRPVLVHFTNKDMEKLFKRIQDSH